MIIGDSEKISKCHKCGEPLDETDWPMLVEGNIERGCYSCYLGMDQSEVDELVQFADNMICEMATENVELRDRVQELEDELET